MLLVNQILSIVSEVDETEFPTIQESYVNFIKQLSECSGIRDVMRIKDIPEDLIEVVREHNRKTTTILNKNESCCRSIYDAVRTVSPTPNPISDGEDFV